MIPTIKSRVATADMRRVPPAPKAVAPFYTTPEYRRWREAVIARAGRQCEALTGGRRCTKAEPHNRMFADHIKEVRDGGALLDVANGQCLCGGHHTAKTAKARAARRAR